MYDNCRPWISKRSSCVNNVQIYLFFQSSVSYFTLVFANSETRCLLTSHTTGEFSQKMYMDCMDKCYAASKEVFNFYKNVIKNSYIFN